MLETEKKIEFSDIAAQILKGYYTLYNLEPVKAEYILTDNMVEEYRKLRPDHAEKEPDRISDISSFNGYTVCPKEKDGVFTVLINRKNLLEYLNAGNMTWVGTIVHETTHVRDYTDYAELIGALDYEDILTVGKNAPFQLWTEFNARAKGYYFVRKYTFDDMFDEKQIDNIVNFELPTQEQRLYKDYHGTRDGAQQAYYVAQFLGRLYSLQCIFPNYFTDKWVSSMPLFIYN
ncbi:MAG: hypothetical protein K5659_06490, partial [Lachnospiraceae bacterium]|nr:hypothetical protein [Lachnospiraceae bacterium]